MPKGPSREWKKRMEPILDDYIIASMQIGKDLIHPPGEHDLERGGYAYLYADFNCQTQEEATLIKQGLKRAATHVSNKAGFPAVGCNAWIEKKLLGGYHVKFRAVCKDCSHAWLIDKYGADRSKWPYDPLRKRNDEDHK